LQKLKDFLKKILHKPEISTQQLQPAQYFNPQSSRHWSSECSKA